MCNNERCLTTYKSNELFKLLGRNYNVHCFSQARDPGTCAYYNILPTTKKARHLLFMIINVPRNVVNCIL